MKCSILLPALLLASGLWAQNIDSLRQVLAQQQGVARLPGLLDLCDLELRPLLSAGDGLQYAKELMVLAAAQRDTAAWVEACICTAIKQNRNEGKKQTDDWLERAGQLAAAHPELMARVLFWKGEYLLDTGQQDAALGVFNQGVNLFATRKLPQQYHIMLLGAVGKIYSNQGAERRVDSLGLISLSLCNTPRDSAIALRYIANAKENLGHPDAALIAYLNAYRIEKRRGNVFSAAYNLRQAASILRDQQRYEQAIKYYEESVQLAQSIHFSTGLASTYHSLAVLYKQKGQYNQALYYGHLALSMKQELGRPKKVLTTVMIMAQLYQETAKYSECIALCTDYLPQSEAMQYDEATSVLAFCAAMAASKTDQPELGYSFLKRGEIAAARIVNRDHALGVFQLAAQSHALLHLYEQAYSYQLIYQSAQDSIFSIQKSRIIAETEARYETEKKEQQIAVLAKENQIKTTQQFALLGGFALMIALAFVLWRNILIRKRHNQTLTSANGALSQKNREVEMLLREIHHRVKNNLQVVSSLLRMQARHVKDESALEALRTSQARIRSMALLHQRLYQGDKLKNVPMQPYLAELAQGLLDTYLIDETHIALRTDLDELDLDVDTAVPIGLIANELITNSLKHAFRETQSGEICFAFKKLPNGFQLEVADNGVGLPLLDGKPIGQRSSFGLELVESMAEKLKGNLSFHNGQGSKTVLTIQPV